jgi:hypothetical protein
VPDTDRVRVTTPMQDRLRRAIALLLTCCVLLAGIAALRHEAKVAHVRDARSGRLQHAHALADFHELSTTPHLHGRNVDADHEAGGCTLLAALEHSTIMAPAAPSGLIAQVATHATTPLVALEPPALALYLLAPKTSPPAIV